jgi:4-amino-4-deoxy-L-arabinose transferase-like glycosyltransferase
VAPLLFLGLGAAPFDDPGEGMHAEIARELAVSRDPFALTLNGVRYVDKPPLLYVLLATAFAVGGATEGVARAVPALSALAAVGATAWLGARLLGSGAGVLAGLALATSTGFFAYGRYVRPETLFVAALAWGLALALVGIHEGRRPLVVAGLAAFGVAGLAKDPLGALAPPLVIGITLAAAGRSRPLGRWLPRAGVVVALVLGFGWWLVAEARTPGFTWYTVIDNHVLNVARARWYPDADVPLPAGVFLAVALAGAAPWVVAAALTVARLIRRRAWREPAEWPWVALALWAAGVLGATLLSPFRLPHYGLPAYPAIALLAARAWRESRPAALVLGHAAVFGLMAAASGVAWAGSDFVGGLMRAVDVATRKTGGTVEDLLRTEVQTLLAASALVCGAGAVALVVVGWRGGAAVRRAGATVVALVMLALMPAVASGLADVAGSRAVRDLARELAGRAGQDDLVVHEGPLEDSGALEWYGGRRPVVLDGRRSVLAFGATQAGSADAFWDEARLGDAWGSGRKIWIISPRAQERSLVRRWPGAVVVAEGGGRTLWANQPLHARRDVARR